MLDFAMMATGFAFSEALILGLASGPACLASCAPVLVPSLLAERTGVHLNIRYLSMFLATRLVGYLLFAVVAWELGALVSIQPPARPFVFALIHVLLACVLLKYAYSVGRACAHSCVGSELVTIGGTRRHRIPGAAVLGFLTGVSLCPPFVAAGVRAAEAMLDLVRAHPGEQVVRFVRRLTRDGHDILELALERQENARTLESRRDAQRLFDEALRTIAVR